jgi:hypothetical protein
MILCGNASSAKCSEVSARLRLSTPFVRRSISAIDLRGEYEISQLELADCGWPTWTVRVASNQYLFHALIAGVDKAAGFDSKSRIEIRFAVHAGPCARGRPSCKGSVGIGPRAEVGDENS